MYYSKHFRTAILRSGSQAHLLKNAAITWVGSLCWSQVGQHNHMISYFVSGCQIPLWSCEAWHHGWVIQLLRRPHGLTAADTPLSHTGSTVSGLPLRHGLEPEDVDLFYPAG